MLAPDPALARFFAAVATLLAAHNPADFTREESPSGYTMWLRRLGPVRRHFWVRTLGAELPGQLGVIFGEYPAWEDHPEGIPGFSGFDGRRFGTPEFVLDFFTRWMVEWVNVRALPPPDAT